MSLIRLESLKFLPRYQLEAYALSSRDHREFIEVHSEVLPKRPLKLKIRMNACPRATDLTQYLPHQQPPRLSTLFELRRLARRLANCHVTILEVIGCPDAEPREFLMRVLRLMHLKWSWTGATIQLRDLPPPAVLPTAQFLGLFDNCGFLIADIRRGPLPSLSTYLDVFGVGNLDRFGTITMDVLDDHRDDEEDKAEHLLEALLMPTKSPRVGRHVILRQGSYTAAMLIRKFVARASTDERRLRAVHSFLVQSRLKDWVVTPYARHMVRNRATHYYDNKRTGAVIDGRSAAAQFFLQVTPSPVDSSRPIHPTDRPYFRI